jgi:hypothetical protein
MKGIAALPLSMVLALPAQPAPRADPPTLDIE